MERLLKEDFMEKGHWNRKRVYSIRKFAVGACSVMSWNLCGSIWRKCHWRIHQFCG